MQPPQNNRQRGMSPLFFHPMVGHESEFIQVAMVGIFLMFRRERERRNVGENRGIKPSSSPIFCTSRGRRKATVPFKTAPFWAFSLFFLTVYETTLFWTKRTVSFKWKAGRMCQSSHWSSICDLFNRVLNCNFNCKNQFNYIPVKFKQRPWSWPPFSLWSLVLN